MEESKKRKIRFPLWAKILIVLVLSVVSVSVAAIIYSNHAVRSTMRNHYAEHSAEVADTLALYVDSDKVKSLKEKVEAIYNTVPEEEKVENNEGWDTQEWKDYLAYFKDIIETDEYKYLFKQVSDFHSKNDAKYTYLAYADFDHKRLVYLVDDSPEEERCLPGSFDNFTENDMSIANHIEEGFLPEITNMPEYGWLVSAGKPIFDENHDLVSFAVVDLSMDDIVVKENQYITTLTIILSSISLAAIVVGYLLVLFVVIRPIRKLTKVSNEYVEGTHEEFTKFNDVKINTRDEIEDLANSMKKMENDINHYVNDVISTTTALETSKRKAEEFKYFADRDALTGVMNKRAYFEEEERLNQEIQKGKAKFAVSMIDLNDLKVTNDTLGHERGDDIIVGLCRIVQCVFTKSSIYRTGGDEFVVISEKEDLKNIQQLETRFADMIDKSMKAARQDFAISAALGVAIFNPKVDNNVEDTFKRADAAMYKNKKAMKEPK